MTVEEGRDQRLQESREQRLRQFAGKNWENFYGRNQDHFFKDRHWAIYEFAELVVLGQAAQIEIPESRLFVADARESRIAAPKADETVLLFEVGCGAGNFLLPLLKRIPFLRVQGIDVSATALNLVRASEAYDETRCQLAVCDLVHDDLATRIPASFGRADLMSLIFVLSAIPPDRMASLLASLASQIRPGGVLLLRDYGRGDHAQSRFSETSRLSDGTADADGQGWFVRRDLTFTYFFDTHELGRLFEDTGCWAVLQCEYKHVTVVNRKKELEFKRVFVHARFLRI